MEIQLQELLDQIRKDGVEAAEAESKAIIAKAMSDAEKILADAKAEAEKILSDSKIQNDRMVKSSEEAIRQAGRNLLISFRESVAKELKAIIGDNVAEVFSSDDFAGLIVKTVENWAKNSDAENLSVILSADDIEKLENTAKAALSAKLSKGVVLKSGDNLDKGFRIAVGENGAYYDYSSEAVIDMLAGYLSPKVTALMKEAE